MNIAQVKYKVTVKLQYSNIIMHGGNLGVILQKIEDRYGEIKQKVTVEAFRGDELIERRVIYDARRVA